MPRQRMAPGEVGTVYFERHGDGVRALIYYRDYGGKRHRVKASGDSKTQAKRRVLELVAEQLRMGAGGFGSSTRLETAIREWLGSIEKAVQRGSRSPTTYDQYERNARIHVIPAIGSVQLKNLTTGVLDEFLSRLHDKAGYATAKIARTVLNGTCGMLVRRDALPHNPVRDVGRLEQGSRRAPRALSIMEIQALLRLLDASEFARRKDLPDLVRFLLGTGVRIGEALALRWADVDLEAGVVIVDATVVRARGKGLIRKPGKTDQSDRILTLPGWAVAMLARRFQGQDLTSPVFPDVIGGWRDRSNVARDFRTVRAGSAYEWVTSHTARRTVATILDEQGMTARVIADQLGHARPSMTQDVYMGRKAVQTAEQLESLFPSVCGPGK